ncbi:MAG: hypothetical protein HFI93_01120 [Lachnospiraceae bacterium]|nr:hypothetical protein [Lachnospiraceae bacterium]
MSNILQVTNPVNDSGRNVINTNDSRSLSESQQVQNPVDPTRVVRADGPEGGRTGDAMGEGTYAVVDYESNYGAFIKRMGESLELPKMLEQLFQAEEAAVLFADQETAAPLLQQLFSSIQMNSPEELLAFFKAQEELQAKFSGPFFDGIRKLLNGNRSDSAKEAVLSFLRSYNSFSSAPHTLKQMKGLTEDISRLMLKHFRGEYQDILDDMDWEAPGGETKANAAVLNQRLIPFLASYISKTHDYGPVRNAVMLLVFHAVKYEEGDADRLFQFFDRMSRVRGFEQAFDLDKEGIREELDHMLSALGKQGVRDAFADAFSRLVAKGANGEAGLENIQQFYNIMNGMLVNESVYLPLIHLLLPFRYQDQQVMSEIWVDPDSGKDNEEGRRTKMLLKFDIRNLGRFDLVLMLANRQVGMQLYVPPALKEKSDRIGRDVTGIFKKSGLTVGSLLVREKKGELKVTDVFPEIREKERTINVRI